jgi:heme exporter protein A
MLNATDLACSRGERRLFQGLGFVLRGGDWLHVKGENGSGKTTLLRTLIGLSPPDHGQVRWRGTDTRTRGDDYRRAFVYLGHQSGLKDELTPLENLRVALALDGFACDEDSLVEALQCMGLKGREDLAARHLSAGQKRRVLLARLLLRPAELWVLDEPFNALDKAAVELLSLVIADHLDGGGIAVLTSHQNVPLPGGQELTL